jgi:hypothetical protein
MIGRSELLPCFCIFSLAMFGFLSSVKFADSRREKVARAFSARPTPSRLMIRGGRRLLRLSLSLSHGGFRRVDPR